MHSHLKHIVGSLAAISVTLLGGQELRAEEADSLKYYDIQDVVVIGMKEQAPLHILPVSGTSVSALQMSRRQITSLKDFTGIIPNFIMVDRDSPLTSSVLVRGTGSLLNSSIVMYVDGVPHFEKSSFDFNLNDVEKIDFLRGPQGTQFGRNAMGGTIVVQTRSPFRHQGTNLSLKYGSYNEVQVKASHLGKINDKWAYSVAGNYRHFDGYIPNTFLGEKADKANNGSALAKVEWRPTASSILRLTNSFDYVHQGAYTYGVLPPETMYVGTVSLDHPSSYTRKIYDGGLQFTHDADCFLLRSQLSMQLLDGNYDVDQDGSEKDLFYVIQGEKQRLYSGEVSLVGTGHGMYNWSVGAFVFRHDVDRLVDIYRPSALLHRLNDQSTWGVAVYHQSTLDLSSRLRLEAGVRYDFEDAGQDYAEDVTNKGKPTARTVEEKNRLKFSQVTPKASAQFFLTPESHLYATVSKGYVTGGFNPVYEKEDERTYGPEYGWNYEVGLKGWIIPRRLHAVVALFAIDTKNKQIKKILDGQGVNTYNAGRAMSKGLEVSIDAHLTTNWELNASYGLTHAVFTDYVYSKSDDYTGNFVPYVPRNTVSVGTQYTIPIKHSVLADALTINLGYKGAGDIYWDVKDDSPKQPYYSLLDASLGASKGGLTYSVWGTNLTNTKYLGYFFTSMNKNFGKPGRPLMAGVSVSYSF